MEKNSLHDEWSLHAILLPFLSPLGAMGQNDDQFFLRKILGHEQPDLVPSVTPIRTFFPLFSFLLNDRTARVSFTVMIGAPD